MTAGWFRTIDLGCGSSAWFFGWIGSTDLFCRSSVPNGHPVRQYPLPTHCLSPRSDASALPIRKTTCHFHQNVLPFCPMDALAPAPSLPAPHCVGDAQLMSENPDSSLAALHKTGCKTCRDLKMGRNDPFSAAAATKSIRIAARITPPPAIT